MNNFRRPIFLSLVGVGFLLLAFSPYNPFIPNPQKEKALIQTILGGLNQLHYKPITIDDEFSKKVFRTYISRLDGNKRWLTQGEIDKLKQFELQIDDQSLKGSFELFDMSLLLINKGITRSKGYIFELLKVPFDLNINETIELDADKESYALDESGLIDYWRKSLKYEVLGRVHEKLNAVKEKKEQASIQSDHLEEDNKVITVEKDVVDMAKGLSKEEQIVIFEKNAREKITKNYKKYFKRLENLKRSDRLEVYLRSITNVFDPHTSYYEPKDKENFDIAMSGRLEGIGARLTIEDDYTKVIEIVHGGPAWKAKELKNNDLIVKVAQGDKDAVDVVGWDLDDVVSLIRGKKGTIVKLTVKREDGTQQLLTITRDVIINDEGYAKSVVLDYVGGSQNVGYIKLPRFYADFNRKGGQFCAKDVALEIEKLKAVNVSGIILDLRNNGGGSLREVVKMSGLFIEEGPIVQVKSKNRKPEILEDIDESVEWDGKLIVMVNTFSASASEILAAALQDYNRAVIVGSNSTFGKGTVQRFVDLDGAIPGASDLKPLGEVKLTIQKFYRVNGGSTQLKGVIPDIIIPDSYSLLDEGEKKHDYALEWSRINPVKYNQDVYKINNIADLKANSELRVSSSSVFEKVHRNAIRYKLRKDATEYPLDFKEYTKYVEKIEEEAKDFKNIFPKINNLKVNNLEVNLEAINKDEAKQKRNKDWLKAIQTDVYIEECLNILQEMN